MNQFEDMGRQGESLYPDIILLLGKGIDDGSGGGGDDEMVLVNNTFVHFQ